MKRLVFAAVALFSVTASARFASLAEVPVLVRELSRRTTVKADGTSVDRWSWRLRIQRREAREESGTRSIRYYKSFEQVKILRAGTRNGGVFQAVHLEDAQDRAVSDEDPGFSSLHEYVLSFPDVQQGSEIEFDYEIATSRALEPGFWGQNYPLDASAFEKFSWTIESEKPLHDFVHDPYGAIATARGPGRVVFKLKKPLSLAFADETDPHLSDERSVLMAAGLLSDWSEYGVHSGREFEARARENLPAADQAFAKKAASVKDPAARIDAVIRHVTARYRYFGDWRASEQMYVPRRFAEIGRTLSGDCKDLALLAVKMLRVAGLEARAVLIFSDEKPPIADFFRLPTDSVFNHVIVQAAKDGRVWWVDPTNPSGRADFLTDEIAGRPALVIGDGGSRLQTIRALTAADYGSSSVAEVETRGPVARVSLRARYDRFARIPAGESLRTDGLAYFSEQQARRLMPSASVENVKPGRLLVDKNSGDLHELELTADFAGFWLRTTGGDGFSPARDEVIEKLRQASLKDRAGDFELGRVYLSDETIRLKNVRLDGAAAPFNCEVQSPWLDFSQAVRVDGRDVVYRSVFSLKKNEIVMTDGARAPAVRMQAGLRDCAGRLALLVKSLQDPPAR